MSHVVKVDRGCFKLHVFWKDRLLEQVFKRE